MPESASELRREIFDQHHTIEGHLAELEGLARLIEQGDSDVDAPLRDCGRVLLGHLEEHLDFEERHLVPRLRAVSEHGRAQAERLLREHHDQREIFRFVLGRLEGSKWTTALLARQMRGFVQILRDDMAHEEDRLLQAISELA